ncbi:MAG: hypothetical protein AMS14_11630 [Planctomycetes bacterium DG_20]|nr:MAG: hypothetical protein AMS14_11630 [Planctomycetes bacterium DG_20]
MRPDTVRRLDRHLGVPLCWLLTRLREVGRLVQRFRRRRPAGSIRNVLFVKLVEQGSTVLAARAFDLAARLVGRENLYFLVFEHNRPVVDLMGYFPPQNILTVRDDRLRHFITDTVRVLYRLRGLKIDAAIDMEGFARASVILATLSGARYRVGFHRFRCEAPYRGKLLTHALNYNFYAHQSLAFLSLVKALEADPDEKPMLKEPLPDDGYRPRPFVPTPDEEVEMRQLLRHLAGREVDGPIVLLNPNASDLMPLRRWPTNRFVALGRRLLADHPEVTVAITGAPDEREKARALAEAIDPRRVLCLAGETTLRSLLVLYGLADVLVTNDSGPAHFAALTDIDVVALFGPETPVLYRPLSPRVRCLFAGLACSPCVNVLNHRASPCRDNRCMRAIAVSQVYEAVCEALAARGTRRRAPAPVVSGVLP